MLRIFPRNYDLNDKLLSIVSGLFSTIFLIYFLNYKYVPILNLKSVPVAKLSDEVIGVKIKRTQSINFIEAKIKEFVNNSDEIFNDGQNATSIYLIKNNGRIQLGSGSLIRVDNSKGDASIEVYKGIVDFFLRPGESIFLNNDGERIQITSKSSIASAFKVVKFNDKLVLSTLDKDLLVVTKNKTENLSAGRDLSIKEDDIKIQPFNILKPSINEIVHIGDKVDVDWDIPENLKFGMSTNPDFVFNDLKIIKKGFSFIAPNHTGELFIGLQLKDLQKMIKIIVVDRFHASNMSPAAGTMPELSDKEDLNFTWEKTPENKFYIWIKDGVHEYFNYIEQNHFSIKPSGSKISWSVVKVNNQVDNPKSLFNSFEDLQLDYTGTRKASFEKKSTYLPNDVLSLKVPLIQEEVFQVSILDKKNQNIILKKEFQKSPFSLELPGVGDYAIGIESLSFPNYKINPIDLSVALPNPDIILKQLGKYQDETYEIQLPKIEKSRKFVLDIFKDKNLKTKIISLESPNNNFTYKSDLSGLLYYRYRYIDQKNISSPFSGTGKLIFPISPLDFE